MKQHPEQRDDEIYLGNTNLEHFNDSSWQTKRLGYLAQDIYNKPIIGELRPWFILRSEVEEALAKEQDEDRAHVYRAMLAR